MHSTGEPVKEGEVRINHYGPPCDLWSTGARGPCAAGAEAQSCCGSGGPATGFHRGQQHAAAALGPAPACAHASQPPLMTDCSLLCPPPFSTLSTLYPLGVILYMLLSGMPPFYDKSEPRLLRRIMAGQFSFRDAVWEPVSPDAKDLIRKLLVVDPTKRLTCEQVGGDALNRWPRRPASRRLPRAVSSAERRACPAWAARRRCWRTRGWPKATSGAGERRLSPRHTCLAHTRASRMPSPSGAPARMCRRAARPVPRPACACASLRSPLARASPRAGAAASGSPWRSGSTRPSAEANLSRRPSAAASRPPRRRCRRQWRQQQRHRPHQRAARLHRRHRRGASRRTAGSRREGRRRRDSRAVGPPSCRWCRSRAG